MTDNAVTYFIIVLVLVGAFSVGMVVNAEYEYCRVTGESIGGCLIDAIL